jgi:hypothetical protein
MNASFRCGGLAGWALLLLFCSSAAQTAYPNNATSCKQCHSVPSEFGSSQLTVERAGYWENGKYIPAAEGGIVHRHGHSVQGIALGKAGLGERVSVNLLGDGFVEAIDDRDLQQNAEQQRGELGTGGLAHPSINSAVPLPN